MSGLLPVVSLIWRELGLAPPLGKIGARFDFELGDMPVDLVLQDNGETVLVRGRIGFLEANMHEAGDQLSRVQRLALALTALNGAVLDAGEAEDILERDHQGMVPVHAVATAQLSTPDTILPALRAVLDWRSATESLLTQAEGAAEAEPGAGGQGSKASDTEMIIFQP